jgi:hypothetical protein
MGELGILGRRNHYEMIATSLLYLQSEFELVGVNACGSVDGSCRCMFCYSTTKLENNLEQRYAIKFCVKLREGASYTYENIHKAFNNDSLSPAQVFQWHKTL